MKFFKTFSILLLFGLFHEISFAQKFGEVELISDQFKFTEGPIADRSGNVYFTDQPNNTIWKYTTSNRLELFMSDAGRSNGLYIDAYDNIYACADENNELWKIDPDKNIEILVTDFGGKRLNGPNDVWVAANGDVYFTDPYYQRKYWQHQQPSIDNQSVYLLRNGILTEVESNLVKPNGIVGSPDGKLLYVADIESNKTYQYTIDKYGKLKDKVLFCDLGSDGMTVDQLGNVYLTGSGVTVFSKQGQQIHHIDIDAPWTANVCIGGIDRDYLFITASNKLFKVKLTF